MAQWIEEIAHLECDWCGVEITFAEGDGGVVKNEGYSEESCVCTGCRQGVHRLRTEREALREEHHKKQRRKQAPGSQPHGGSALEEVKTTQYAPTAREELLARELEALRKQIAEKEGGTA